MKYISRGNPLGRHAGARASLQNGREAGAARGTAG